MEFRLNAVNVPQLTDYSQKVVQPNASPNVVFISIDDLNDWVGALEGYVDVQTPNIDRLAAQGMLFKNAHTPVPICNAARTAVMTGLQPDTTGVFDNGQDWRAAVPKGATLPEYFRENGYQSVGAGKLFHIQEASVFDQYFQASDVQVPDSAKGRFGAAAANLPLENYRDVQVAEFASNYLSQAHEEPFFLGVGFSRPHSPLTAPQEFFDLYPLDKIQLPNVEVVDDLLDVPAIGQQLAGKLHQSVLEVGDWAEIIQAYLANISFVDAQVGMVLDAIETNSLADNTVIALWSDHGWHLGEKLHWQKRTLWEEATRVPLIISAPGVTEPGSSSNTPVSLVDLFPTLVDLAGLPDKANLEGRRLTPLLEDPDTEWTSPVVSTWDNSYAVRTQRWRYIRYWDGTEELYDHQTDPDEFNNLADDSAASLIRDQLSQNLDDYFAQYAPQRLPSANINQTLVGADLNDLITGGSQNDTILGGGGDDTLFGGAGENELSGGQGNDFIAHSSAESGVLFGNSGRDTLVGGDGNDTLDGGIGDDFLEGRGGRNTYVINSLGDRILSEPGEVGSVVIASVNWRLPEGFTRLSLEGAAEIGRGNEQNNKIIGNRQDNILDGDMGRDRLLGGDGHDSLSGGSGNDLLVGGAGDDILDGSDGIDRVKSVQDNDFRLMNHVLVGEGYDTLLGIERVLLVAGDSDNRLDASAFSQGSVDLRGRGGNDTLWGGTQDDVLNGGSGVDTIIVQSTQHKIRLSNTEVTGDGFDQLRSIEDAVLIGHNGNSLLDASRFKGTSQLQGRDGDDTLIPSQDVSHLVGGEGADTFLLTRLQGAKTKITDFDTLEGDVIAIAAKILGVEFEPLDRVTEKQLGIGNEWQTLEQRFRLDSDSHLWFDTDGSGEAEGYCIAQLPEGTALVASDLRLV